MTERRIIDNDAYTVEEHLRRVLPDADSFSLVSAYFTIYGYELLEEALRGLDSVRFLFGEPSSVELLDPARSEPKSFELTENGLVPNHVLQQKYLAKRCAEWVRRDSVAIRSASESNFLHGKMYLASSQDSPKNAVVGSSNFTKRGLGGSDQANLEINLAVSDDAATSELQEWFDALWGDEGRTEDVKRRVLNALDRIGNEYAPESIYYKTLYELFRKEIEALRAGDDPITAAGFSDSDIWKALYEFQKDGARTVINKLKEHNGCILADSVGLGKTYTALAVIKYFELHNTHVLVLCPSKLRDNWSLYQVGSGHSQNPFRDDRFGYTLLAHTDLSRDSGSSGGVDLSTFDWRNYGLVVIDESHNFRNSDGKRYQRLLEDVIKQGASTKVLMLSATPVNTSLIDLRNQIYLMTEGRENSFQESLGVNDIRNSMASAQKQFKEWETGHKPGGKRDKAKLLADLGADFQRLLSGVSISRSRRQIEQFYAEEMERVGQFPERETPVNRYPQTDLRGQLSFEGLKNRIEQFTLSLYQPSGYVTDPDRLRELEATRARQNFNQRDSERFLVGMIRTNFLKRLESSPKSLTLTLERTIEKIDYLLDMIERFQSGGALFASSLSDDDIEPDDDDDFEVGGKLNPYRLSELDVERWRVDLKRDRHTLNGALQQVAAIAPERDGKLKQIRDEIRAKAESPTLDLDDKPNRKLLVFTTFKDTALYLYDNLADLADELGLSMAMVSGEENRTADGDRDFNSILTNFAPTARNRRASADSRDIDLLIATDCISEGQNLQDCDTVINYDIHWNPVRLIQRFGRIDRIGSRARSVRMVNYWPTSDMDKYLKLEGRVQARMALADLAATGDEDPFTDDDAKSEIDFRDRQLLKLREQILTMDDLDDDFSMGDFTLDYFFTQLVRYLEGKKDELESMPNGAYAVADAEAGAPPGIIFFLRQRNASSDNRQRPPSPVHPYYLAYIRKDGGIRFGCGNAKQILGAFDAVTMGKTSAIIELCDRFDSETDHGRDMATYDKLLNAVIAHIKQTDARVQTSQLRMGSGAKGFVLPKASETPRDAADFDLITWLVVEETA